MKRKWKRTLFLFLLIGGLMGWIGNNRVLAKEQSVVRVKNEKQMIQRLITGLRKHQNYFAFTYEGIEHDYENNCKHVEDGSVFWEKVARKDGYIVGVLSGQCMYLQEGTPSVLIIQVGFLTTKKQERYINKKIKKIVKRIGKGSRRQRIKNTRMYLIHHLDYCEGEYNPYVALKEGKGMCMSYALLFQRIMQEMRIPCRYIHGKNHAWNQVKMKGKWYLIDVTFEDAQSR